MSKGIATTRANVDRRELLSSGSTLLNLACTGWVDGAFRKGSYSFMVGDSSSGKTFLSRTCLAEAAINSSFKEYRLIFDDVEGGALMDTERYFGSRLADRLEPPAVGEDGGPIYSETVEEFYFHVDDALNGNAPFVYVLDSMDGLSSLYEGKKFDEKKTAARGGKKAKGDYGDGKAKINSSCMRQVCAGLRDTGSILIVLNQTRDNIDAGMFGAKKTRSGGHALTFYATHEIWLSKGPVIKKRVRGKDLPIGVVSRIRVRKNRSTGRERQVDVPIYYSYGIDDIGGCVDFLVEWYWLRTTSGVIMAKDFDFQGRRDALIQHIESNGLEFDLRQLVSTVWMEVESACEVRRKSRYAKE